MTALQELAVGDADRLYLRPVAALTSAGRTGARIGGAWAGFDHVEVLVRDATGDVGRATAPLEDVRVWSRHQGRDIGRRAESLLARITAPRPAFAGVAMDEPRIMGVVNVTPDSFSDGGDYARPEQALVRARAHAEAGAAFLDIGGESTRPGSEPVDETEELSRTLPVVKALAVAGTGAVVSIDTRKARVMELAVGQGARVVNDISALTHDDEALATVARLGVPVILMHSQGDPKTMQEKPVYRHAPTEIYDQLAARIAACEAVGIPRDRIAVDPGIGFGKLLEHNLAVLSDLSLYHGLGCPVLLGVSRKSFIGHVTGEGAPKARLPGSLAAMLWGVGQGAQIIRVHDVAETRQALEVWRAIAQGVE